MLVIRRASTLTGQTGLCADFLLFWLIRLGKLWRGWGRETGRICWDSPLPVSRAADISVSVKKECQTLSHILSRLKIYVSGRDKASSLFLTAWLGITILFVDSIVRPEPCTSSTLSYLFTIISIRTDINKDTVSSWKSTIPDATCIPTCTLFLPSLLAILLTLRNLWCI